MAERVGAQQDQLGLREVVSEQVRRVGGLAFNVMIHTVIGALDGVNKGLEITECQWQAKESAVLRLEVLANDPEEHKKI